MNMLEVLLEKHPDKDFVITMSNAELPVEAVVGIAVETWKTAIHSIYNNSENPGMRILVIDKCKENDRVRAKEYHPLSQTEGWPVLSIRPDQVYLYLVDIQDAHKFKPMEHNDAVRSVHYTELGPDVSLESPGVRLLPIRCVEMTLIDPDIPEEDLVARTVAAMAKDTVRILFEIKNIHNYPQGFMDDVGDNLMLMTETCSVDCNTYNLHFKTSSGIESYPGITLEQAFALYEMRKTSMIQ